MSEQNPQSSKNQQRINQQSNELGLLQDNLMWNHKATRSERISKLQQLLKKNDNVRPKFKKNQTISKFNTFEKNESFRQPSLPLIKAKSHEQIEQKKNSQDLFVKQTKQAQNFLNLDKSFSSINSNTNKNHLIRNQHQPKGNESCKSKQKRKKSSFLKFKVKMLSFQNNLDQQPLIDEESTEKFMQNSIKEEIKIQNLFVKEKSEGRQEKESFRKRRRDMGALKFGKIELLPQIIFLKSQKCSKPKFHSSSMREIDNKLLNNEIIELEKKAQLEKKTRQKNNLLFKTRMKNQFQQNISLQKIPL